MGRHSGTWATKYSAQEVIELGKGLTDAFHQLSNADFTAHVRKKHNIDYRRALDWINAARRFNDRFDLIDGLTEATIRRLSGTSLTMDIVEQIISEIKNGAKADYRSIETRIREIKDLKKLTECSDKRTELLPPDMTEMFSRVQFEMQEAETKLQQIREEKATLQLELKQIIAREKSLQSLLQRTQKQIQGLSMILDD